MSDGSTVSGSDILQAETPIEEARLIVFFVSPRIIDFDTYLPTAMALKAAHPEWDIRFVTFSKENYDYIQRGSMHVAALEQSGTLFYLGSEEKAGLLLKLAHRIRTFFTICGWIMRRPRPVLFLGIPYSTMPYVVWYALARLKRGSGYMLWKIRSPDKCHHRVRQVRRVPPAARSPSALAHLLGRQCDGLIHYHDDQEENIAWASSYGKFDNVPRIKIGMPHYFAQWRNFMEAEVERERARLQDEGIGRDVEIYAMFPAKPLSSETLREPGSIEMPFAKTLAAISRLRPKSLILVRPHPLAQNEPYVREAMERVGRDRARLYFGHPEAMIALSRRAIFNNPTNILFSCYFGRLIDVSDYAEEHFSEFGDVSLAHGYGAVYVNPRSDDFESRLATALESDEMFDEPELTAAREDLLRNSPADVRPLLSFLQSKSSAGIDRNFH